MKNTSPDRSASLAPIKSAQVICMGRMDSSASALCCAAAGTTRPKSNPSVPSFGETAAGRVHFNRPSHEVVEEWIEAAVKREP